MFVAVPPLILPTFTVEKGGSKRRSFCLAARSAAMRSSSTISAAAAAIALTPSCGTPECASRPLTVVR
jgi:hypothetical protein